MSISPGPARPRLLSLVLGSWRCRCPLLLCCLLMLVSCLPAASLHVDSDALRPSGDKNKINLTEFSEEGRRIQVVNSEHVQGGSRLYVVPSPGPRVLIQVNFTRIQSGSTHVDNSHSDSFNDSSNNNDTNIDRDGSIIGQKPSSKSDQQQLRASLGSSGKQQASSGRGGSRSPGGGSSGWDMLAVGDTRRQQLHQPEGDQLKHKQPVATAPSRTSAEVVARNHGLQQPATDEATLHQRATLFKTTASTILLNTSKIQWPGSVTANETALGTSPTNVSSVGKLFPALVKTTQSHHSPIFNALNKDYQAPYLERRHSSSSSSKEDRFAPDTREGRGSPSWSTFVRAKESVAPRPGVLPQGQDDFVPGYGGLLPTHIGSNNVTSLTTNNTAISNSSATNNTRHPHLKRLFKSTSVRSSSATSSPPHDRGDDLSLLTTTKSFSARDSQDVISPTLTLSELDGEHVADTDLSTRVLTHTDYSQNPAPETDLAQSQDCSLKVIIEETELAGAPTTGSESRQRAQPQVICWQSGGGASEGRSPLVYRYTTPIKITYLWADKKNTGLTLKFSFPSVDEVECHFQCSTTPHLCLVSQQLCDGYTDCPDQSDERPTVCDSALNQGITGKGSKVPRVIASVVIPCGFVIIIIVVFLMIKHKRLGHPARRSGDSLLSSPQAHSSEACHSSQDSGQNEALLPDRPPPYSTLHQEQQQQHQQLLTYTGASVVSSLQPAQISPDQHSQYLLPQQHHQQQQHQQKQHHHFQYQQLQHPNNNVSSHNINNNDLPGAVSFQQQQIYPLPQQQQQQQQHMLLQQPLPSPGSNIPRDRVGVQQLPPVSLALNDNGSNNTSPHDIVGGFQAHLYNNPLSNNDDSENRGNTVGPYHNQYTHTLHHQQHQKSHRQSKQPQAVTNPQATSGFSTMSVLLSQQQQCPPHIPVSLDGEEGYSAAQRSLHSKRQMEQNLEAEYGIFRAPPNRSALERDSPPPPYSLQPPSTKGFSLDSLLSGSYFSSSCPTSFTSSSSQSPVSTRGGRGRGGGGHSQDSFSPHNCASTAHPNRH